MAAASTSVLYNNPGPRGCKKFLVHVDKDSVYGVVVHVEGLHAPTIWMPVAIGESVTFEMDSGIHYVYAQGEYGTATNVTYGVVGK